MIKDDRAILWPFVFALTVDRRRVMASPEHLEQVFVADDIGIEIDHDDLGMPGDSLMDHLVRRVRDAAAGIARDGPVDPLEPLENVLDMPETARTERRLLGFCISFQTRTATPPFCRPVIRADHWRNSWIGSSPPARAGFPVSGVALSWACDSTAMLNVNATNTTRKRGAMGRLLMGDPGNTTDCKTTVNEGTVGG